MLYFLVVAAVAPVLHPYLRAVVGLTVALAVFALLDVAPALARGESPRIDADSALYSVRGLVLLIVFVLVAGLALDTLRAATTLSGIGLTVGAVGIAVLLVFGPVVGYYWRGSLR
jgi:hypothetical protein